jgi:hypothetical protein
MRYIINFLIIAFLISSCNAEKPFSGYCDEIRIENDLRVITKTPKPRNYLNNETLHFVANYIFKVFSENCDTVYYQKFFVNGLEYKNVIGVMGPSKKEKIVVGAHYDVFGNQEGADDNASGVVGVIEIVG